MLIHNKLVALCYWGCLVATDPRLGTVTCPLIGVGRLEG